MTGFDFTFFLELLYKFKSIHTKQVVLQAVLLTLVSDVDFWIPIDRLDIFTRVVLR